MMLFTDDFSGDDLRPPKVEGVLRRLREEQQLRERPVERRRNTNEPEIGGTDDPGADPPTR